MDSETKEVLTNTDLIAIDLDPPGKQGFKIKGYGEIEIYYKPLQNGDLAIWIFNRFDKIINIELAWNGMKLTVLKGEEIVGLELKLTGSLSKKL